MRRIYRGVWQYFKSNKKLCALVILLVAEVIVYSIINIEASDWYEGYVAEARNVYPNDFALIFVENTKTSLLTVAVGIVPFFLGCIMAVTQTVFGLAASFKYLMIEVPLTKIIVCIAPHGVFEITAMVLAVCISVILCKDLMKAVHGFAMHRENLFRGLGLAVVATVRAWLLVCAPLLLAGAVVEVTVSTWIANVIMF